MLERIANWLGFKAGKETSPLAKARVTKRHLDERDVGTTMGPVYINFISTGRSNLNTINCLFVALTWCTGVKS